MSLLGDKERHLTKDEKDTIKKVFGTANLPDLDKLMLTDGKSPTGTAFTDSDHRINIGPSLFSLDLSKGVPSETLVHEMTHAWQYHNGTLTRKHGLKAQTWAGIKDGIGNHLARMMDKGRVDDDPDGYDKHPSLDKLYSYDTDGTWEDMGFEGQANMVEHWYKSGMPDHGYEYLFIKYAVWEVDPQTEGMNGKQLANFESLLPHIEPVSERHHTSVAHESRPPLTDAFLVSLLKPRFDSKDVAGFGARAKRLESVFSSVNIAEAIPLFTRLVLQSRKDPVAVYFHDHLSTPTRKNLLKILEDRSAGKPQPSPKPHSAPVTSHKALTSSGRR